MSKYTKKELDVIRNNSVTKSNKLVLDTRYELTLVEQKIILFLVSQVKQNDTEFTEYPFDIKEFGEICGADITGGENQKKLKKILKDLRDKSFWATIDDEGTERLFSWLDTVEIRPKTNKVMIQLHRHMIPYLLELKNNFLDYKLYNVLAMKSRYGVRFYEIFKAEINRKLQTYKVRMENGIHITYDMIRLRQLTMTQNTYPNFADFRRKVLDMAKKDINQYSPDLMIEYEPVYQGRKVISVSFFVRYKKTVPEGIEAWNRIVGDLQTNHRSVEAAPSGAFCFGCIHMNDDVCNAFPSCPFCGGDIEGQTRLC